MTTVGVPISNHMSHDELCEWNADTARVSPADECWECAVIARVHADEQAKRWEEKRISYLEGQESMRAQFAGIGCAWVMLDECPNGPDCLSCQHLDALVVERQHGWLEGRASAVREIIEAVNSLYTPSHDPVPHIAVPRLIEIANATIQEDEKL